MVPGDYLISSLLPVNTKKYIPIPFSMMNISSVKINTSLIMMRVCILYIVQGALMGQVTTHITPRGHYLLSLKMNCVYLWNNSLHIILSFESES